MIIQCLARGLLLGLMMVAPGLSYANFDSAAALYRQKKYVEALNAFEALGQSGDVRAQTVLGLMYKYGEGTKPDLAQAYRWYITAARKGYAPAQYNTAEMYLVGLGVEKNREKALYWLKKSSAQGYEKAADKLLEIAGVEKQRPEQTPGWSKNWDLGLPVDLRFEPLPVATELSADNYWVQVGAMSTRAAADRLWSILIEKNRTLFIDKRPKFSLIKNSTGSRLYRIQTGPFNTEQAAATFCEALLERPQQAGCQLIQ